MAAETEVKEVVETAAEAVQEALPQTGDSFDLGKFILTAGGITLVGCAIYGFVKWQKAKKEPKVVTVAAEPTPAQAEPEKQEATEPVEPEKLN